MEWIIELCNRLGYTTPLKALQHHFDEDELVSQLREIRESLRNEYSVGKTLHEQLAEAIASEQYERAAEIRDQLSQS